MDRKLVSIVLPTYNRAGILGRTIESCLGQSYGNIELVVVDDGSTDETGRVAESYAKADGRVRYFTKENGRLPRALNYGFERAAGEYLTWTSDDNLYLPGAVSEMARVLDQNSRYGMVYCDFYAGSDEDGFFRINRLASPPQLLVNNGIGACFLYRREVYEETGDYDPELELAEDYDYWIRVSQRFEIGHIDRPLYVFAEHGGSLTANYLLAIQLAALASKFKNGLVRGDGLADSFHEQCAGFFPHLKSGFHDKGRLQGLLEKLTGGLAERREASQEIMKVFIKEMSEHSTAQEWQIREMSEYIREIHTFRGFIRRAFRAVLRRVGSVR